MVKARLCNAASQRVAMRIARAFKSDDEIKRTTRHLTVAGSNNACLLLAFRYADRAFVWMGRKKLDEACGRCGIAHDFVWDLHGDGLVVTIGARMIVGPGD